MALKDHIEFGFVAQGQIAVGVVAIGGTAIGVVAVGGISVGVVAIGGITMGALALGAIAVGWKAVGAVSLGFAGGKLAMEGLASAGWLPWKGATGTFLLPSIPARVAQAADPRLGINRSRAPRRSRGSAGQS